jgi:phage gp45-like
MKNLAPGESALYSADGKHVYLKNGQIEIDAKNQPVNIINASAVTITSSGPITLNGNLKVNGIITASGTITPNVP